jgi:hypothetical protein
LQGCGYFAAYIGKRGHLLGTALRILEEAGVFKRECELVGYLFDE